LQRKNAFTGKLKLYILKDDLEETTTFIHAKAEISSSTVLVGKINMIIR
jgi:hypothetical protein